MISHARRARPAGLAPDLYQVDRVRFAAADHRAPIGCPDVANPLRLAGQ